MSDETKSMANALGETFRVARNGERLWIENGVYGEGRDGSEIVCIIPPFGLNATAPDERQAKREAYAALISAVPELYEFAEWFSERRSCDQSKATIDAFDAKWFGKYPQFKVNGTTIKWMSTACDELEIFLLNRAFAKARGQQTQQKQEDAPNG